MNALDAFQLHGTVAVVTGGGSGLGAAGAKALADAGAHVVVVGRTEAKLKAVAEDIASSSPGRAGYRVADVADPQAVDAVFAAIAAETGPVHVLVNNAGQAHQAPFPEVTPGSWDGVLGVNLTGAFLCSRAFLRHADPERPRSIVNIASLAASVGVRGQAAYAASKAGLVGLTRTMAVDLARDNVRVNALAPGYFRTDMPAEVLGDDRATAALLRKVPQHRVAEPEEIGPPLIFLASDASRFMTGAVLNFDGGYTAQ